MSDLETGLVLGAILGLILGIPLGWFMAHSSAGTLRYSNEEEWEILRDERGRTRGIKVHRDSEEEG